jgi:hypothetical protein
MAMVVDQDAVYWIESDGSNGGGQLVSVPKTGGTPTVLTNIGIGSNMGELVSDGEYLFFTDLGGKVRRVHRRGGWVETIAWDERGARNLTIEGDWLYWLANFGRLRRIRRSSGLAETVRSDLGGASAMAFAEDALYVFDPWRGVVRYASGALGPTVVLPARGAGTKLISRNGEVYVVFAGLAARRFATQPATGTVMRLGPEGAVVLASGQNVPGVDVAATRGFMYWINGGDHALMRVGIAGGAPERVTDAVRFVADESGVYAATAEGAIVKVE